LENNRQEHLSRFAFWLHFMEETFRNELGEQDFESTLLQLRQRAPLAWKALVGQLRCVTLPWIARRVGPLPAHALLTEQELALEIFAESLFKFYQLFERGSFLKPQELQSLMFKIAELKTKEALRRVGKEKWIYRPSGEADFEKGLSKIPDWNAEDDLAKTRAQALQKHLGSLQPEDRKLLERVYAGEKMSQIAQELGTNEENLRKRKQRALEKLKQLLGAAATMTTMLFHAWTT
jgi:RNA polymerase sigma factor (sigma-70 family)